MTVRPTRIPRLSSTNSVVSYTHYIFWLCVNKNHIKEWNRDGDKKVEGMDRDGDKRVVGMDGDEYKNGEMDGMEREGDKRVEWEGWEGKETKLGNGRDGKGRRQKGGMEGMERDGDKG